MPTRLTRSSWLFPPQTRIVQFDEQWSFVGKKQKNCDPLDPADDHKGDYWDHVAYDPEHRLVLAVVPGARVIENAEETVQATHDRLEGRTPALMTSDAYSAYASAIETVFGTPAPPPERRGPGRPPGPTTERQVPPELNYATVCKRRERGRVVEVLTTVIFGTLGAVLAALEQSRCGRTINTSYVERFHGTDRSRNARKVRRTYRFSKDYRMHEAMTSFTRYSYNFCWPVRTLRQRDAEGRWQRRTPAMAAGLADHVWSLAEWLTFPTIQQV